MRDKIIHIVKERLYNKPFIDFAILFGSQARGDAFPFSDIDIGIYVNKEIPLLEIGGLISELEEELRKDVDIIVLNDLYKKDPRVAYEIVKDAILIFEKRKDAFFEYRGDVYVYYFDVKWLYDMFDKKLLESIKKE